MHFNSASLLVLMTLISFAMAYPRTTLSRRQDATSFNFDFEHPDTGDVGTLVWDLSTLPIRHPLVDNPPPNVDAETASLARSMFASSVTGENIYCEVFQNEECTRSSDEPSFCVVGQKFQRTNLEIAPKRDIFPADMHGKMKCLVCDKKTAKEACKETGERS